MKEIISTISSKGQVTIPATVRRHLGVEQGDKLSFVIDNDGKIELKTPKYPNVDSVVGVAGTLPSPLSWKEMKEIALEDHLRAKYKRE